MATAPIDVLLSVADLVQSGLEGVVSLSLEFVLSLIVCLATLVAYYVVFGAKHQRTRHRLQKDLALALARVDDLQAQLADFEEAEDAAGQANNPNAEPNKEVRIFLEGAFDMMHYGHMNAFRQGRALGTHLVVGVNSDETIEQDKGSRPVMSDDERLEAVRGCKWVDEVIPRTPYVMTPEYLEWVIETYKIDFVVHGDDPCIVNGRDVYELPKRLGKYKSIPRTEGVSTTDIVGRMLLISKEHHDKAVRAGEGEGDHGDRLISRSRRTSSPTLGGKHGDLDSVPEFTLYRNHSQFLTTGNMIRLFSANHKPPAPSAKVVYLDGDFDMLHAGHMRCFENARALGDYLIVGIHSDAVVNRNKGANFPILTLNERVLSVLGCNFVDDVLVDAPWEITLPMIKSLNVSTVVHAVAADGVEGYDKAKEGNRFLVPKAEGVYAEISYPHTLSVMEIIERIHAKEGEFRTKYEKKNRAEEAYYKARYGDAEADAEADAEPAKEKKAKEEKAKEEDGKHKAEKAEESVKAKPTKRNKRKD